MPCTPRRNTETDHQRHGPVKKRRKKKNFSTNRPNRNSIEKKIFGGKKKFTEPKEFEKDGTSLQIAKKTQEKPGKLMLSGRHHTTQKNVKEHRRGC